jgi:hypothetical protein
MRKLRRPSPALAVAALALFITLGGTAFAAEKIVARAKFALNAGKLQGKTAAQVAAMARPTPPAPPLAFSTAQQEFRVGVAGRATMNVSCGSRRAIGGAWNTSGESIISVTQHYGLDPSTWRFEIVNQRGDGPAVGNVIAICAG